MKVLQTSIPDTSFAPSKRRAHVNLEYKLKQPTDKCFTESDLDDLVNIWGEIKWEVGELNPLGPTIHNLKETLQNHKYYEKYYKPFMTLLRSKRTMSSVTKINQGKCTRLCSAVPLPLKAAKVLHDIPYSYFYNDPHTRRLALHNFVWYPLSINLLELQGMDDDWKSLQTLIHNTRDTFYKYVFTKKPTGVVLGSVQGWDLRRDEDDTDMLYFYKSLYNLAGTGGNILQRMAVQSWVWHPSIRHPDMLMHPFDWDLMPSTLAPNIEQKTTKRSVLSDDDIWEL